MATLLNLAADGVLDKFDAELGSRQQPMRAVFFRPGVFESALERLEGMESEYGNEISPLENWEDLLNSFVAGEVLIFDRQIKPLTHFRDAVWELKTLEIRMFGWFYLVDHFICNDIDLATRIKHHNLYNGYRDAAVRFRNKIDLSPPKFLIGDDPRVVVSSVSYP